MHPLVRKRDIGGLAVDTDVGTSSVRRLEECDGRVIRGGLSALVEQWHSTQSLWRGIKHLLAEVNRMHRHPG